MSRNSLASLAMLLCTASALVGCGDSDSSETVAQAGASTNNTSSVSGSNTAAAAPAQNSGAAEAYETYGGGSYSGESSSGRSGGGSSEESSMSGYDGGYDGYDGYEEEMGEDDYEMSGYDEANYDPSYGSGEMNYGPTNMGYGGGYGGQNNDSQFLAVNQFLRQNCINCHGPREPKGEIRLDVVNATIEDRYTAQLWRSVLEQLEAGTMPPAQVPRRPDPQQQQVAVTWIKDKLASIDPELLEDEDYLTQAQYAFAIGKESDAMDLLYAYALAAEPEESQTVLSQTRWFAHAPRPATTVRFAAGVILDASNVEDVKPIGSKQFQGGGGGGSGGYGGSYGGESDYGAPSGRAGEAKIRTFHELTGEFGDELATAFESRWSAGNLGTVFNDVTKQAPRRPPVPAGMQGYGEGMGDDGYPAGYDGSYGGDGGYGEGYGGGGYDPAGPTSAPGGDAPPARDRNVRPGQSIVPGLVYLGSGSQAELVAKAKEEGVDGLFLFDVKASRNRRTQLINNETRLRLLDVSGSAVAATKTLMNTEVERARMRGVDDELDKNIQRLFSQFDSKFNLNDLPPLKPEHARSRVRQLLADPSLSKLNKLFEAKLFHSLGLLTDEETSKVYQIVFAGNEGIALADGSFDDRKLVLEMLVSKSP